jgi:hypothetical protein
VTREIDDGRGLPAPRLTSNGEIYAGGDRQVHLFDSTRGAVAGAVGTRRIERAAVSGEYRPGYWMRGDPDPDRSTPFGFEDQGQRPGQKRSPETGEGDGP